MTEMVPYLIWAQEIWAPRNLILKKFGPRMKIILMLGPKFLEDQIPWGPNFSGTKFLGDQKSQEPK